MNSIRRILCALTRGALCTVALGALVAMSACGGGSSGSGATPPPPAASLDSSFGLGGIVAAPATSPLPDALVSAIAIQPDGKIVAAGTSSSGGSLFGPPLMFAPSLARYNNDGTLDLSFGNKGIAGPPLGIPRIALQPDGKILVLSGTTVLRFNVDGSLDATFGAAGTGIVELNVDVYTYLNDLALQTDGRILLAGYHQQVADVNGVSTEFLLMRLTAAGIQDSSFGQGAGAVTTAINKCAEIAAVAVTADGAILAAGIARACQTLDDNNVALARYDANGVLDTNFGVGGVATVPMGPIGVVVRAMAVQPDGRIVVAGSNGNVVQLVYVHHFLMLRFLANGALDLDFGTAGIISKSFDPTADEASAVAIQSNGKIVAVGYAGFDSGSDGPVGSNFLTARFDSSGVPDPDFGNGGSTLLAVNGGGYGLAMAIQPDGRIVAAGAAIISVTDQSLVFALIRYFGDPVPGG